MSWHHLFEKDLPFDAEGLLAFRGFKGFSEFRVDLSSRPATADLGPGRSGPIFGLAISLLILVAGGASLLDPWNPFSAGTVLFAALCAILFFGVVRPALGNLRRRRMATFDRLDVHVTEPDGRRWRCGYRHFLGVRQGEATHSLEDRDVSFLYVELVHADETKNLLLYAATTDYVEGRPLADYAAALGVPVIDGGAGKS